VNLGEHPIVIPMIVAFVCGVLATVAAASGAWVTSVLAYGDALGMTAIAAHSRIERGGR
jgi:hypothetical protein